MIKFVMMDKL